MSLVAGQSGGTVDYYPKKGGVTYDPVLNGGSMTSMTVFDGDGTTQLATTTTVAKIADGHYRFTFATAIATPGNYPVTTVWAATGSGPVVTDTTDTVQVEAFGGSLGSIVTTADVRTHMSLTTAQVSDAELQHFIDAATVCIERWVGPVVQRTITETSYDNAGQSRLFLQAYPAVSITSVTDGPRTATPTALAATAYELDPVTSCLVRLDGQQFIDRTTVVFLAGRTVIGEHIRKAALNYVSNEVRRVKSLGTASFGEAGFVTSPAGLDNIVRNDLALDPYFRGAWVA